MSEVLTHPLKTKSGIWLTKIDHQNQYDFSQIHRHAYFELLLFENVGSGSQLIDFSEYKIEAKSLYIISPNQVHLMKRDVQENGLLLQFSSEYLQTSVPDINPQCLYALRTNPQTKLTDGQYADLQNSLTVLKELTDSDANFKEELIRHYFAFTMFHVLEFLQAEQLNINKAAVVMQFLNLVEMYFKEIRNVGRYASMLGVSESKLNVEVKKATGKTPLLLLHDYLKVEIKRLVVLGQHSHKEISFLLNFDSQSSYTRFVQKQFGLKPSELQKSVQFHK